MLVRHWAFGGPAMRAVCLVAILLLASSATATELWRWVDDNGVVHYSDRPVPGAEKVIVSGAQTFSAPSVAPSRSDDEEQEDGTAGSDGGYQRFAIASPDSEETLWNIEGRLNVSLDVRPAIRGNHELRVFLDGQAVEVPAAATSFTLGNVFRGEHTVRASIVDENGREVAATDPVTFYVRQTSLQNPNNPQTSPPGPRPRPRTGGG